MAESARGDRLLVWGLAAFHTALFTLVPLLLMYQGGSLGHTLSGLSTLVGVGAYLALLAIVWGTVHWALRGVDWRRQVREHLFGEDLVAAGIKAGGLSGALVWVLPVLLVGAATAWHGLAAGRMGIGDLLLHGFYMLLFLALGAPLAALIGAVVGLGFVMLDCLLLRLTRALLRDAANCPALADD